MHKVYMGHERDRSTSTRRGSVDFPVLLSHIGPAFTNRSVLVNLSRETAVSSRFF